MPPTRLPAISPIRSATGPKELLPWVRQHYQVTNDPSRTVVAGSSYGGLAAAYAGLRHPELFGKILSQSGSFWWKPGDEREHEWLIRQFVASPRLPLSFYVEAGLLETWSSDEGLGPFLLVSNRHFRDVLQAKGYPIQYAEYNGGHDFTCWRGTLADGLLALLGS